MLSTSHAAWVVGAITVLTTTVTAADPNTMERVWLNETATPGTGKCIDGSSAAMYIAANASNPRFVIWLEGGGICQSLDDCKNRATGDLGSSNNYAATIPASRGMLTQNSDNLDFGYWNRIFVPYCSGDVWEGTAIPPLNPWDSTDPWRGQFQGHTIVEAVMNATRDQFGLSNAKEVILTGCSAGGIGTFFNCDYVANYMAKLVGPGVKVRCRPEAGWFGDAIPDYAHFAAGQSDPDPRKMSEANWTFKVDPWALQSPEGKKCIEDVTTGKLVIPHCTGQPLGPASCCGLVPIIYPYIQTPMFVSENTADSYQVFTQNGCPEEEKPKEILYALGLREILSQSLVNEIVLGAKNSSDGLFAPACLRHCMEWVQESSDILGRSHAQAFGDWYFGRGTKSNLSINESTNLTTLLSCSDIGFAADQFLGM